MRIAIIGTGAAGTTLAPGLVAVGHEVVFGSRTPASKSGLPAPVVAIDDAISGADLVINALAGLIAVEALSEWKEQLAGHILLDLSNATTPERDLGYPNASLGAAIQEALPQTRVVKSINTLPMSTLIAPDALSGPSQLFLSGDDADAKATVSKLLIELGWPVEQQMDLGGIVTARGPEHWAILFFQILQSVGAFNLAVVR